jgi:hypothetical protein
MDRQVFLIRTIVTNDLWLKKELKTIDISGEIRSNQEIAARTFRSGIAL